MSPQQLPLASTDRVQLAGILKTRWPNHPLRFWRGEFFEYSDSAYQAVSVDLVKHFILRELDAYYDGLAADYRKPALAGPFLRDVRECLQAVCAVPSSVSLPAVVEPTLLEAVHRFDENEQVEPGTYDGMTIFANGLLNLRDVIERGSAKLFKANAGVMSVNAFAFEYDRHACCPLWTTVARRIFEDDPERIAILQEIFGYCLFPGNPYQKFFQFEGSGRNGKTTVAAVLGDLIGEKNISYVPLDLFAERFQLAPSIGKLVNVSADPARISARVTSLVKQFSGGDPLHIDRKQLSAVSAPATAKLLILCNEPPEFLDHSQGLWRRLIRVPFTYVLQAEDYDPFITDKLHSELSGIFNWAVEGLRRLEHQKGFTQSSVVTEATQDAQRGQSSLTTWIHDNLITDDTGVVSTNYVYARYVSAMEDEHERPVTNTAFGRAVKSIYPRVIKQHVWRPVRERNAGDSANVNQYIGLALR